MRSCPRCSSSDLTRDGHDERGRVVYTCAGCGRHATVESGSLVSLHGFPRDSILLAVRYYLQLGAAAERIAGVLADRGIDVSGRTISATRDLTAADAFFRRTIVSTGCVPEHIVTDRA